MRDRHKKARLFVISSGIVILVTMAVTGVLTYMQVDKLLTDRIRRFDLVNLITAKASRLNSMMNRAIESSLLLAEDPVLTAWFRSRERDNNIGEFAKKRMKKLLAKPHYHRIFAANRLTGNFWVDGATIADRMTVNDPDDSWFFTTLRSKRSFLLNIDHNRELRNTYLWINAKMRDANGVMGVAGVGLDLTGFTGQFTGKDKLGGSSFLFDRNGKLQAGMSVKQQNSMYMFFGAAVAGQILQNPDTTHVMDYSTPSGHAYFLVHTPVAAGRWLLLYKIPKNRLRRVQQLVGFNTLISSLLTAVLVSLIFVFVYGLIRAQTDRVA